MGVILSGGKARTIRYYDKKADSGKIDHKVFAEDEITVRFSHRIVTIHPFSNGNGRHSGLIADILVGHGFGRPPFSWGSIN